MHVGTGRTALFNWLYARHTGGEFIVRIDDTDLERSTKAFEADILAGLRWLGLDWDEGVEVGGPHGTYRQSDRYDRYREAAEQLVAKGAAYPCFCTTVELEERRALAEQEGRPPGYDGRCRAIDPEQAALRRQGGEPAAIRFAMPRPGATEFADLIRGEVRVDHANIDDFVILRSDSRPTYHLASTVDDVDYQITHVARGEDLLPSTPRHIQITRAMGGTDATYAHIPLINGPDGKRFSKRHGAKGVTDYIAGGFLPEALRNYLCLLGWSPGGEATIFDIDEAIAKFELTAVAKNPAVFDETKLEWMNGEYVRALDPERFRGLALAATEEFLERDLDGAERAQLEAIAPLVQERTKLLTEIGPQVAFLFQEVSYDEQSWSKVMTSETGAVLDAAMKRLGEVEPWEHDPIEVGLRAMLEELGLNARKGLQPLRVAVTGSSISPPLFESMAVLGKDRVLERLAGARARL